MSRKPSIVGNLALAGYEDIFKSSLSPLNGEQVVNIPLADLNPPEFHPFQVNDDAAMERLTESIKRYGVREPGLARPSANGGYELLCGNRRKRACELAGITTLPVIIREMGDDTAAIAMVDSNLEQREKLLYSEKAWAYRVKLEALNHNGVKGDMLSVDVLVAQTGESRNQIFRLVRLTELIVTLLDKVDARQLAFNPAVELSYLSVKQQTAVVEAMAKHEVKPSLSQAQRLKKQAQAGTLTNESIDALFSEEKKPTTGNSPGVLNYRNFFPSDYTPKQMDKVIVELLTDWKTKHVIA